MHVHNNLLFISAALLLGACGHATIPGTQIPGSAENRAIYKTVQNVTQHIETRNAEELIKLVSTDYYEDMGTADPNDDFSYVELKEKLAKESFGHAQEMRIFMTVHDIIVDGNKAYADIRYSSRARLKFEGEHMWDTHKEFNRIEFKREGDRWMVTSGL